MYFGLLKVEKRSIILKENNKFKYNKLGIWKAEYDVLE